MDLGQYAQHVDIPEIRRPQRFAVGPSGVAVACFEDPGVVLLDRADLSVRGRVLLDWQASRAGAPPSRCPANDVAIAQARLFIAQTFSDFVVVADQVTGDIVRRLPIGGEGFLSASPDGRTVYFASNLKNEFSIIDAQQLSYETIPFPPNSRGVGALLAHADGKRLLLGLQRGGEAQGQTLRGGNCHLAVFDVSARKYIAQVYLAEVLGPRQSDHSIPNCLTLSPDGHSLYVGMFQSRQGILVVDLKSYEVLRGIRLSRSLAHVGIFDWVDPLAQAIYGDLLLSVNRNNYELAVVTRRDEQTIACIPLGGSGNGPSTVALFGDRALIGHNETSGLFVVDLLGLGSALREGGQGGTTIGRDPQEVTVEDIQEFAKSKEVSQPRAKEWTSTMSRLSEDRVKQGICKILGDIPKKDWGGESADHYTSSLHIGGRQLTAAFLLKGPSRFCPMTLDMLGKRANQIQRLAGTEAGVLVVQHAHEISEDVRKELRVWARQGPYPRYYCFIDGKDTYRLLTAYDQLRDSPLPDRDG